MNGSREEHKDLSEGKQGIRNRWKLALGTALAFMILDAILAYGGLFFQSIPLHLISMAQALFSPFYIAIRFMKPEYSLFGPPARILAILGTVLSFGLFGFIEGWLLSPRFRNKARFALMVIISYTILLVIFTGCVWSSLWLLMMRSVR